MSHAVISAADPTRVTRGPGAIIGYAADGLGIDDPTVTALRAAFAEREGGSSATR